MKTVKYIAIFLVTLVITAGAHAQSASKSASKTETVKVYGNCGMCKERIEKAAKLDGVTSAEWNKDSKMLTLVYNPSKVKSDDVLKKIAAVGHDSDKFKADDKVYNALHSCCKYR
jgi:copper chaperone CopZ